MRYLAKQKISQTKTKADISDIGGSCGILKILGMKFGTLHRGIVLTSSSILANVQSTNVNENLAQTIVPGNVKSSRIVSWPREHQRISKYKELLNSAGENIRSEYSASA